MYNTNCTKNSKSKNHRYSKNGIIRIYGLNGM
jgi:hypothetical protein